MTILITNGRLYTPHRCIEDGAVLIDKGKILAAGAAGLVPVPNDCRIINAAGNRVIPGLTDVHLHSLELKDAAGSDLADVCERLPAYGITSFLPTTYVAPRPILVDMLEKMAAVLADPIPGAQVLGIHMEGPWFAPTQTGMVQPTHFYPLTRQDVESFQQSADGWIRMVTFAPEEGNAIDEIPWLLDNGIIPAAGHTDADYDTIRRAAAMGLNHATHTYNAMRGFHHREPGALGAVLDSDEIIGQLIADGHHVHPAAMRILIKAKGIQQVCLVSDATPPAGSPAGEYEWYGYKLISDGETSRLPDGTLAGSVVLLNRMLQVLVDKVHIPFKDAVRMGSEVPAKLLGVPKGQLTHGYDADIVILGDDYLPVMTLIKGKVVYEKGA